MKLVNDWLFEWNEKKKLILGIYIVIELKLVK